IHDVIYVHIDKKKKFPATALLRAFGHGDNADILRLFFAEKDLDVTGRADSRQERREIVGAMLAADVPNPEDPAGDPLGRTGGITGNEHLADEALTMHLPLGISFFTFHGLTYVIDIYRRDAHVSHNPLNTG